MPVFYGVVLVTSAVDFSKNPATQSQSLNLYIDSSATSNVVVTAAVFTGPFSTSTPLPLSIAPGNIGTISIDKSATTGAGSLQLTATVNGVAGLQIPVQLGAPMIAVVPADTQACYLVTSAIQMGLVNISALSGGTFSQTWTLVNNSASSLTIDVVNISNGWATSDMYIGYSVAPGQTGTFNMTCQFPSVGFQDGSGNSINSQVFNLIGHVGSSSSYLSFTGYLTYKGILFVSANNLTGTEKRLVTYVGTNLNFFDSDTLSCEEPQSITRQFDFELPGFETHIGRFYTRLENVGNVSIQVGLTTSNGDNRSATRNIGTTVPWKVASSKLQGFLWDLEANGELSVLTINIPANSGPLSLTMFGFHFVERGEIYEGS